MSVAEREAVLFKLYAMKTNHVFMTLLSDCDLCYNRSVKCDTAITGDWEYLNAQGVYVI